jgi:drug/metabolite transporter (DMT)-like permease
MSDNWFARIGTRQGIFYGILSFFVGAVNDVVTRFSGVRLQFLEVTFFRCLFSTMMAAVVMFIFSPSSFKTSRQKAHFARSISGTIGIVFCSMGVQMLPLAENSTLLFSEVIFTLPLSAIILKEKVSKKSIAASMLGLIGVMIIFRPSVGSFNSLAIIPIISAFGFTVTDIILRKMANQDEQNLTVIFYFGIYSTILCSLFLPFSWVTPNFSEILLLIILGCGGSLIQFFAYLAYRSISASSMCPIRYTELIFTATFGYCLFSEKITKTLLIGAVFIVAGTLLASINKDQTTKLKQVTPK